MGNSEINQILRQAELFPKGDIFSYSKLVNRLEYLALSHSEYEGAVKELARIIGV